MLLGKRACEGLLPLQLMTAANGCLRKLILRMSRTLLLPKNVRLECFAVQLSSACTGYSGCDPDSQDTIYSSGRRLVAGT